MLACLYLAKNIVALVCFIFDVGKSHYPCLHPKTSLETFSGFSLFLQVYFCQTVIVSSEKTIDVL